MGLSLCSFVALRIGIGAPDSVGDCEIGTVGIGIERTDHVARRPDMLYCALLLRQSLSHGKLVSVFTWFSWGR
jgi:hypothetical protein